RPRACVFLQQISGSKKRAPAAARAYPYSRLSQRNSPWLARLGTTAALCGVIQITVSLSFWSRNDQKSQKRNQNQKQFNSSVEKTVAIRHRKSSWALPYLATAAFLFSFGWMCRAEADLHWTDDNPLQMPALGSYGLRVLSPTLLELTLITTKGADSA